MADYVASNTKRLKVLYTGPRGSHHMVFRFPEVQSEVTMIGQARAVCASFGAFTLEGTQFESAEVAHEGSEVFLPVTWGAPVPSTSATGVTAQDEYGRYLNIIGRTTGGSRVAFYLFNAHKGIATANNRLTSAENPNLTTIFDAFTTEGINMVGIDQNPFVLKSYANTGINDAVAKKSRALA